MRANSRASIVATLALAFFAVAWIASPGAARAGIKVAGDDETYLKIGGLLQAHGQVAQDAAPDGSAGAELYLRRMRLMFYGQINDKVNYFVETDSPRFGKDGNFDVRMFIQDAYLELNLHEAIQVDFGMLLLPFSHHGMQGATSLLGLDYHGALIGYPDGGSFVWRDFGLMLRGMPFGKWLEYRVGLFNGVHGSSQLAGYEDGAWQGEEDPRNPMDLPRLTARLTFNIFDAEGGPGAGGMFYDGLYIKKTDAGIVSTKRVLSLGASVDWQRELNVSWEEVPTGTGMESSDQRGIADRSDYLAFAGDLFWDIPLGEAKLMSLNGQVDFYYYDHGDRSDGTSWYDSVGSSRYTGYGLASELGFRWNMFQPLVAVDWYESTEAPGDIGDRLGVSGGIAYWAFAQSFNLKLQLGGTQVDGSDDWNVAGTMQGQLLF